MCVAAKVSLTIESMRLGSAISICFSPSIISILFTVFIFFLSNEIDKHFPASALDFNGVILAFAHMTKTTANIEDIIISKAKIFCVF